jgi:hypothetical protein
MSYFDGNPANNTLKKESALFVTSDLNHEQGNVYLQREV